MRYNEEIWRDLSYDEKMAYKIADQFTKKTKARGQYNRWIASAESKVNIHPDSEERPGDKIRNSKNFKYFEEVWDMYKNDPNFDIMIFIDSVFHNITPGKKIYPAQLKTKRAYNDYKQYRMKMKLGEKIGPSKQIMEGLASTYKLISRKLDKKKLSEDDLNRFFNEVEDGEVISPGMFYAIQEMISPFYMSVSKSFRKAYFNADPDIQQEIIDEDKLENLKALVRLKSRVHGFAMKLFGSDILK